MSKYLILVVLLTSIGHLYINSKSVAIIGGGIGGTSAAYYLSKSNINIDKITLFEGKRIGGRINSMTLEDKTIELGASFFIKENVLINRLIDEFNLEIEEVHDITNITIMKNKDYIDSVSSSTLTNVVKTLWNYGYTPFTFFWKSNQLLKTFIKIYDYLDEQNSFSSFKDFIKLVGLEKSTEITIEDYLIEEGLNQKYIDIFIQSVIGGIYNQNKHINAFAGLISIIGMNEKPYRIKEGNNKVVVKMLESLKNWRDFEYKHETINKISKEGALYQIETKESKEIYDIVILAGPIRKMNIEFSNIELSENDMNPSDFQSTIITAFKGDLNPELLKYNTDMLLFSEHKGITEIVKFKDNIYIIQSQRDVRDEELEEISPNYKTLFTYKWEFAYPKLKPILEKNLPRVEIAPQMYYINGMESIASCMELSLISSKNVVNRIINQNKKENIIPNVDL